MKLHSRLARLLCVALAALVLCALEGLQRAPVPEAARAQWPQAAPALQVKRLAPIARGTIPMPEGAAAAHASFLLAMPATSPAALTAFWFAGERESAPDVQIAVAQMDRITRQWSAARFVVNRHTLGQQLGFGVRRLGNPVAWIDGQSRIHLLVVATGWGGWAASRIVHLRQTVANDTLADMRFEPLRALPLSWLWNTSFLVRNAPLTLADGGMVLPVYFELGYKYPAALRFDRNGAFTGMVRISRRHDVLQPTLLMQTPQEWLALLRTQRADGKIGVARSTDGGAHWSDGADLDMDNPDAAITALALAPGQMVLAHNPSTHSRSVLDLSRSPDGLHWSRVAALERGTEFEEYSYPSLAWVDGSLCLSYTMIRKRIAWQCFGLDATALGAKP